MGMRRGMLFVISAPSGAGKTSLVKALLAMIPDLSVSISHTTRPPRPYEQPGSDYHFVSEKVFQGMIDEDQFLEYAKVFDYHYGTSRPWLEQQLLEGNDMILEIDWQGAQQVRHIIRETINIFILPPSFNALAERLRGRGDEDDNIARRMHEAIGEMQRYREYDYLVVNDDFDKTLDELSAIFTAARHEYRLQRGFYEEIVEDLLRQGRDLK